MTIKLTPAEFDTRRTELARYLGYDLPPETGTIYSHQVTAKYAYDGESTLTIDVLSKPFLMPESFVDKQIIAWFAGA